METALTANQEAIEAWNGPLFDRFVRFRAAIEKGLGQHSARALEIAPPRPGERVLDVGCGFGDTARELADLVGPGGEVLGVDAAERFVQLARSEAADAGYRNLRFAVADVEAGLPESGFDYAFSRFGTMFFANPVGAMRRVRGALRPGGRLCMVVWRRKLDNDWLHRSEQVAERYLTHPEQTDEPTCGPGPFSMANADTTSDVLRGAGWEDVTLTRCDVDIYMGPDVRAAVDYNMALGPAGELIRVNGEAARPLVPEIEARILEALGDFVREDGVRGPSSSWIVTATAP